MLPFEVTNNTEQLIVYKPMFIGMKHISPTCMYIIPMYSVSEADNIYKNPSSNVISPIFYCYFNSLWGSTNDSADCWSAHRSPSCPRLLQMCARLMQGWVASAGCLPNLLRLMVLIVSRKNCNICKDRQRLSFNTWNLLKRSTVCYFSEFVFCCICLSFNDTHGSHKKEHIKLGILKVLVIFRIFVCTKI